jgi:aspartyl-tRNA(Asn)/glutamyl-tRNA(Gln) amidotransferase subunit A
VSADDHIPQAKAASDLCRLTLAQASKLIEQKRLSPVELTEAFLARIAAVDPKVHAYITVTADQARKQAREAEAEIMAGRRRGPLHGIPYALKDNIGSKGVATTANSRLLLDNIPAENSACVAKLEAAGAVLVGKTAMREFAMGAKRDDLPWPYPLNPWNTAYEFGSGSSTGSAAAVSAGMAMAALGTDTGGSIRNPAGTCGIVGLRPTYGRVSRIGVVPNSFTLDAIGPIAWTAEDCALMLQVISGFDADDPGSAKEPVPDFSADLGKGVKGLRIGVIRRFYEDDLPADNEMRTAFEAALQVLRDLGAKVETADFPSLEDFQAPKVIITTADHYAIFEEDLRKRPHLIGPKLRPNIEQGMLVSAVDYIQAQRRRLTIAKDVAQRFRNFDVLVTLTALEAAPLDAPQERKGSLPALSLTMPFSLTGMPAMSVPTGFDRNGLPLAMQIAGKAFDEAMVLRVGHAYLDATPWKDRRPAI